MDTQNQWKEKWITQPGLMLITVVIWAIFVGLCIQAGALAFTFVYSFFKPIVAENLYEGLNLYGLYEQQLWYYAAMVVMLLVIAVLKAYLFYVMIRIFLTINLNHPFSKRVSDLIAEIANVALQIGVWIIFAAASIRWLAKKGYDLPSLGEFTGGAFEYLLLGALIFGISEVFKRGVKLQSENELTI